MISKLFYCLPLRCNLFLKLSSLSRFHFSILAESNVSSSNTPSQNLFAHFVTTRFNISSAEAAKMLKNAPSLGRLKTLDKVEQLVYMLHSHGCSEDQIAKIIRSQPSLMLTSAETVLQPKIQLLKDSLDVEEKIIAKIVTTVPALLTSSLELIRSNLNLLKTVFPTQEFFIRAVANHPYVLRRDLQKTLEPSVAFWEDFGFRGKELAKFLLLNPWVLNRSSLTPAQLDLIRNIGIHKESKMYKYVVNMVATSRIEVLEGKIDNLRLCGFSPAETWELVRGNPAVLSKSEETIKKKMDFMLNHLELSVDFVRKRPRIFSMSLEKLMRPRVLVLQNMASMNGGGKVNPRRLYGILLMTEAKFVAQIIQGHPESAALLTIYKNAIADVSKNLKKRGFKYLSI